jgi:hypothetical protein
VLLTQQQQHQQQQHQPTHTGPTPQALHVVLGCAFSAQHLIAQQPNRDSAGWQPQSSTCAAFTAACRASCTRIPWWCMMPPLTYPLHILRWVYSMCLAQQSCEVWWQCLPENATLALASIAS